MRQLNVSITPHFVRFISGKVTSGRYSNASEVVREALRRFEQDEQIREQDAVLHPPNAQKAVTEGFAAIERGDYIDIGTEKQLRTFFSDIARRGKKRLKNASKK